MGHRLKPKHVRYVTGSRHKRFLAKFFEWVDETMQKAREGGEEEEGNGNTDDEKKERGEQEEQENVKVWFKALDETWFEEERKREARGRKTKSPFQTALESFLGMGSG